MRKIVTTTIICIAFTVFGVHTGITAEQLKDCGNSNPMFIDVGDIIDCEIDNIGGSRNFKFDASDGDKIRLTLVDWTSDTPLPRLKLYDPDGLISNWWVQNGGNHVDYSLTKTGEYTIVISEYYDIYMVKFRIALQRLVPSPPEAQTLNIDSYLDSDIDPIADSDVFVFNGMVGDKVRLTLVDMTSGTPLPRLKLYDPDGVLISNWWVQNGGNHVDYSLTKTGKYTIVTSEYYDYYKVSFRIALQGIVPSPPQARRLCHINPYEYEDDINPFADSDVFFFDGTVGDKVRLTLVDMTSGTPLPRLKLYDPDGVLISNWWVQNGGNHVDYSLTKTGEYTIVISEYYDYHEVTYILRFTCISGKCFGCPTICSPFEDVLEGNWACNHIKAIYEKGITQGCSKNPMLYCPKTDVNRDQMAAFIVRAVEGEPPADYCATGSPFADVDPAALFCKYIKRLSELDITQGCGGDNYCPKTAVRRDQMAAFLVRAVYGEPPADYCDTGSPFSDVSSSSLFCKYIKKLSEIGITKGCGGDNYCPENIVKRDQMAVFLGRAFLEMD